MTAITSDMAKMVRMLCAIALLCVGFAHKAPLIETAIPPSEFTFYTLPDGTLPILCLPGQEDDGKHHDQGFGNGCEACRIASSIVLPSPSDQIGQPVAVATEARLPMRREAFYRQLFPPNATPRGPPAGLTA